MFWLEYMFEMIDSINLRIRMGVLEQLSSKRNLTFFCQVSGRSAARNHPNPGSSSDSGSLSWMENHLADVYPGSGVCTFTRPQQGPAASFIRMSFLQRLKLWTHCTRGSSRPAWIEDGDGRGWV